jgi:hypothetical protein
MEITAESSTLSEALQILAGEVCLQVGKDTLPKCTPVALLPLPGVAEDALCTWLCRDAHFFTLFRPDDHTLIYSHTNEILYHASLQVQLAPSCPKDVGFLCQFTFDSLPEGRTPRLLAFDVLAPLPQGPVQRGEALRALQSCLPLPVCCVQWIGYSKCLSPEFVSALPHPISGVMAIGDNPLAIMTK